MRRHETLFAVLFVILCFPTCITAQGSQIPHEKKSRKQYKTNRYANYTAIKLRLIHM